MECEEVQICDICGDAGYDDELAICAKCNDSAEHIYCMATMLDEVPLQWVCERCEMEEKASAKKRLACNESLRIEAIQKHTPTNLYSCSKMKGAKNVVGMPKASPESVLSFSLTSSSQSNEAELTSPSPPRVADKGMSRLQTWVENMPKAKEKSVMSPKESPTVKACLSMPRPEAPVSLASPTSTDPLWFQKSDTASKVFMKGNANITQKDVSNTSKSLAGSKGVFSRSVSLNVGDDQPTFLLSSRPKNLTRSKTVVVRPSVNQMGSVTGTRLHRNETSAFSSKLQHTNELTGATRECATGGPSCEVERAKSTFAELRTLRQAGRPHDECLGEQKNKQYGRFLMDSQSGGQKNKQYDGSSKDSELLQFFQCSSDWGKRDFKDNRRCYRCHEVGHIAAKCKNSCSSSPRVCEASKAPATFDKTTAAEDSRSETRLIFQSETEKKSSKMCSSKQTDTCGKVPLTVDTMNWGSKVSSKSNESGLFCGQQMRGQVRSPKARIGTSCSVQSNATLQQDESVNAVEGNPQGLRNPVFPQNDWGSDDLVVREAASAVDTFPASHSENLIEPCVEILWSGCFNILSTCLTTYNGMQAHASTKADPRVSEAVKRLPVQLHLEELKRGVETDTWPRSLVERRPTSSSIGVYFFPVDMECHDIWYKPLLDHLAANDLALKTTMDFFQLLIFPSQLLPEADQCWEDRQYLWGILRSAAPKSAHAATLANTD